MQILLLLCVCVCACVCVFGVTLQVYSPMCLCVILAGNWVLLICVRGRGFCSNIAHMHIKLLYELNTCLRLRRSSSSLACCRKTASLNKWSGRAASPLPSPRPVTPSWPGCDLVTDGADKMRLSAETYRGKHADEVIKDFTLSSHCYQSNLRFFLTFYQLWLFSSPSLFNNNPLSSFLHYGSLLFPYQWFIRLLPVLPYIFPFLSPLCLLCAALLVSVSIGSGSSLWVYMAWPLTVTACLV